MTDKTNRNEYHKEWNHKNPDKQREYNERYWRKKLLAQLQAAEPQTDKKDGDVGEGE